MYFFHTHKEFEEPFVRETMLHPLTSQPEVKSAYGPSKWEKLKVDGGGGDGDDDDDDDDDDTGVMWTQLIFHAFISGCCAVE